jgi:hypothetical protein
VLADLHDGSIACKQGPAGHEGTASGFPVLERGGPAFPRPSPVVEEVNVVGYVRHSSSGSHFMSFHVISVISFQGACGEMMK